jgi:hypothetical protein
LEAREHGAIGFFAVPRNNQTRRGQSAVRDRSSDSARRDQCGAQSGHHLDWYSRAHKEQRLLASTAEDERIAALEPHDASPTARLTREQPKNNALWGAYVSHALAHGDPLGALREVHDGWGNEGIVENNVRRTQSAQCPKGEQLGIAGPGTDEAYVPVAHGHSSSPCE